MLDKSIFVSYSTPNYEGLTNIFMESLLRLGIEKERIQHKLDTPDINLMKNTGFQSDWWYLCVTNKLYHLIDILNNRAKYTCDYFIFSDCDIWFPEKNKHEWNNLQSYIDNSGHDIYFMRQYKFNKINSGLFIIKNNENIPHIANFFRKVVKEIAQTPKADMPFGDQSIVQKYIRRLNYSYIPIEYVIFGTNVYNKQKSLFHHAISCSDVDDKVKQIEQIKAIIQ